MNRISIQYYKSPFGELILGAFDDKLCLCDWRYRKLRSKVDKRIQSGLNAESFIEKSSVIDQTINQLKEFFQGKRTTFDVPVRLVGSDFQIAVWNQLSQIPYGSTTSYLELAKKLGNEHAIRAVAAANGANAISIIIPCHRVIGADGSLTGYAGGLKAKEQLLKIEGYSPNHGQLGLFESLFC